MFCKNCGKAIPDDVKICPECQTVLQEGEQTINSPADSQSTTQAEPPKNYLVPAILVTIFCCWPLGIPAIVYAAQVNSKFAAGNYEAAEEMSRKAKKWTLSALICGIIALAIYIVFMVLSTLAASSGGGSGY